MSDRLRPCPFCGSKVLYEGYHNVDGFTQPFMFCNSCKAMFTVEASEDWVTGDRDGMEELRAAWNTRAKPAYATVRLPEETQRRIEQMVRETVTERLAENGVVRCRDCKNFEQGYTDGAMFDETVCWAWDNGHDYPHFTSPDGFCYRGERRTDG